MVHLLPRHTVVRTVTGVAVFIAVTSTFARSVAAQWTQGGAGRFWVKSALFWQRTDEEFDLTGTRRQRIDLGEANSWAVFTDIIVGLHPRVDLWLQIPFLDLRFTNVAEDLRSTGFGDLRGWIRWQPIALNRGATPLALRAGAKAPLGPSPLDVTIIPLGEGQWDLEVFGEVGHSFWPVPAYAELWLGYRARFENETLRKDPGGEFVFLAELGGNPLSGTLLKVTADGMVGRNWIVEGVRTASSRRIVTLHFGAGARLVKQLWLEGGLRVPVAGRNFPAGTQLVAAVSSAFAVRW